MKRRLAALSALASTLFPALAQADAYSDPWSPGGGVFVGYSFGDTLGVVWGAEVFATYRMTGLGCTSKGRAGLGPLARFALVGLGSPRLTLAAQGGGELQRASAAAFGELGGTIRFGDHPEFGVHTGFGLESTIFHVFLREEWLLNDGSVGAGVRVYPTYGVPGTCVDGRPLRTAHGHAPVCTQGRRLGHRYFSTKPRNEATKRAAREWERDAQYECASVPAFLQLAEDLLANEAPDDLVERALLAASDEIRHARVCAQMASRYSGERVVPVLPAVARRAPLIGALGLRRLAEESWMDGCLSEGAAAKRAARAGAIARDPTARDAKVKIAADEARHAELGWDILRWAMHRGGDDIRDAVRQLRDTAADAGEIDADDDDAIAPFGCVRAKHTNVVLAVHRKASRQRLDESLSRAK